jgi:hypothetical protein
VDENCYTYVSMKSHSHIYAILAIILVLLIIGGSVAYYNWTSQGSGPSTGSTSLGNNPFGLNNTPAYSTSTRSSSGTSGSNSSETSHEGTGYTDFGTPEQVRIVTTPSFASFSQAFVNYKAPLADASTPFTPAGVSVSTLSTQISDFETFKNTPEGQVAYQLGGDRGLDAAYDIYVRALGGDPERMRARRQSGDEDSDNDRTIIGAIVGGVAVGALVTASMLSDNSSSASGASPFQNFGGRITNVTYCTCMASVLLDINDVRGESKSLLFMPGASMLYSQYNVYTPGVTVLGDYTPGGGACLVYHGEDCTSEGNPQGTIHQIGTNAI